MPSTKPEPVNIGTPTLTATPTTPDTTDSGETEQQRLDRLYPVGPDTRVDGRYLYTILRSGRQPTEDEWRECQCTAARRGAAEEGPRSTGAESRQGTSGPDSRGRHRPGKPPETAVSSLRVVLPQPAHVTKTAHETKLEIVTEPFVPTPEEASPTKTVTQLPKTRRRPRSSSDAPQDRVDATPRRDRGAHPKIVVPENVVPRSVNLVTGKEEIEVLDAGELAVERSSKRPARNRIVQSGNVTITTDARGRVSTQRRRRTKLHPYLRHGW